MIEIIIDKVKMPELYSRRFQKSCKNFGGRKESWFVIDTQTNTIQYRGRFEDVCLVSHNLNKKNYRETNG